MTDRRSAWLTTLVLSLAGCPRARPAPIPPPTDATTGGLTEAASVPEGHGLTGSAVPVELDGAVSDATGSRDVLTRSDTLSPGPTRPALAGPWRRLPRVAMNGAPVLATWDEPPDLDGDNVPDPLSVVTWDPRLVRCTASDDDRPCPMIDPDDSGGGAAEGPLLVAVVAFLSGEGTPADRGREGRLVGLRRLWQAATDLPSTHVAGFEFAEFGPGVTVRSTLATHGAHADDTLDVVDLYTGVGLDRHAGAMVQHCTREPGHTPVRTGAIAVSVGNLAPLVWRAAQAHPFSGCATDALSMDASLGQSLARGAVVRVTATSPAGTHPHVSITWQNGTFHVADAGAVERPVERPGGHTGESPGESTRTDPLAVEDRRVLDITHGCTADRVRYTEATRRCVFQIPRDDGPMPGCEEAPSPLDPRPSRPLALVGGGDGGALRLVFTRGGSVLSTAMPARCGRSGPRVEAVPWRESLPAGLAASPDGQRVMVPSGFDLWLFLPGRRAPVLLNPPGGALPRGTVRAVAFADPGRAAAVIGQDLLQFDVTVTDDDGGPTDLRIDPGEVARTLRGM